MDWTGDRKSFSAVAITGRTQQDVMQAPKVPLFGTRAYAKRQSQELADALAESQRLRAHLASMGGLEVTELPRLREQLAAQITETPDAAGQLANASDRHSREAGRKAPNWRPHARCGARSTCWLLLVPTSDLHDALARVHYSVLYLGTAPHTLLGTDSACAVEDLERTPSKPYSRVNAKVRYGWTRPVRMADHG
ncbi:hypothetical protein OG563_22300 [Nocardia vinacea]|uniref:Uncharacterized protein n=1 Tax=Nocardia vinacea TaxID=96468 RepID=A0ABZ1Z9F1_9NOCA|nr:hypothetical protein [Nocardia vinacea]